MTEAKEVVVRDVPEVGETREAVEVRRERRGQLVASAVILLAFAATLYTAQEFASVARWFPTGVAVLGLALTIPKLVLDLVAWRGPVDVPPSRSSDAEEEPGNGMFGIVLWAGVVLGLLVLVRVLGFLYGVTIWLPLVMMFVSKARWYTTAIATVAIYALLWCSEVYLGMRWPPGFIDMSGFGI